MSLQVTYVEILRNTPQMLDDVVEGPSQDIGHKLQAKLLFWAESQGQVGLQEVRGQVRRQEVSDGIVLRQVRHRSFHVRRHQRLFVPRRACRAGRAGGGSVRTEVVAAKVVAGVAVVVVVSQQPPQRRDVVDGDPEHRDFCRFVVAAVGLSAAAACPGVPCAALARAQRQMRQNLLQLLVSFIHLLHPTSLSSVGRAAAILTEGRGPALRFLLSGLLLLPLHLHSDSQRTLPQIVFVASQCPYLDTGVAG